MDRRSHSITGVLPMAWSFNGRHLQGQSILEEMGINVPGHYPGLPCEEGRFWPISKPAGQVVVVHVQQGHGSFAFEPSIMSRHQA